MEAKTKKEIKIDMEETKAWKLVKKSTFPSINLGYLSCDWRNHPMGRLTKTLVTSHNLSRFNVSNLSYGLNDGSTVRREIEEKSPRFIDYFHKKNDIIVAQDISNRQIDILVDITGHTYNGRLAISAMKPAPIIINYLGFPGSTGCTGLDFTMVEKRVVPPEIAKKQFSEKLIYLPFTYQANHMPLQVPTCLGGQKCHKEKSLIFSVLFGNQTSMSQNLSQKEEFLKLSRKLYICSFNTNKKMEPLSFLTWSQILRRLPNALLLLLNTSPDAKTQIRNQLKNFGIPIERVGFLTSLPWEDHLSRASACDLVLDTFVYGAHTTASDMLWMGVPVLSLRSWGAERMPSRVAASITTTLSDQVGYGLNGVCYSGLNSDLGGLNSCLNNGFNSGLGEDCTGFSPELFFVVDSVKEFEETAVRLLKSSRVFREKYRRCVLARAILSPAFDFLLMERVIESAYQSVAEVFTGLNVEFMREIGFNGDKDIKPPNIFLPQSSFLGGTEFLASSLEFYENSFSGFLKDFMLEMFKSQYDWNETTWSNLQNSSFQQFLLMFKRFFMESNMVFEWTDVFYRKFQSLVGIARRMTIAFSDKMSHDFVLIEVLTYLSNFDLSTINLLIDPEKFKISNINISQLENTAFEEIKNDKSIPESTFQGNFNVEGIFNDAPNVPEPLNSKFDLDKITLDVALQILSSESELSQTELEYLRDAFEKGANFDIISALKFIAELQTILHLRGNYMAEKKLFEMITTIFFIIMDFDNFLGLIELPEDLNNGVESTLIALKRESGFLGNSSGLQKMESGINWEKLCEGMFNREPWTGLNPTQIRFLVITQILPNIYPSLKEKTTSFFYLSPALQRLFSSKPGHFVNLTPLSSFGFCNGSNWRECHKEVSLDLASILTIHSLCVDQQEHSSSPQSQHIQSKTQQISLLISAYYMDLSSFRFLNLCTSLLEFHTVSTKDENLNFPVGCGFALGSLHVVLQQEEYLKESSSENLGFKTDQVVFNGDLYKNRWESLHIIFYCNEYGQSWWPGWGPSSLKTDKGMGGSEEAVYYTAQELGKFGHHVEIYNELSKEDMGLNISYMTNNGVFKGSVSWFHYRSYNISRKSDVFIAWRYVLSLPLARNSKKSYLWLHDLLPGNKFPINFFHHFDGLFVQSDFHKYYMKGKMEVYMRNQSLLMEKKIIIAPNGVAFDNYNLDGINKKNIFIYASSPSRGLESVLKIWEKIKNEIPNAELHIYYGFTETIKNNLRKTLGNKFEVWYSSIKMMLKQDGVVYYGPIGHKELSFAFSQAGFLLYPTTFVETGCITVLKAMSTGLIPITSRLLESVLYNLTLDYDLGPKNPLSLSSGIPYDSLKLSEWLNSEWLPAVFAAYHKSDAFLHEHRVKMKKFTREKYTWLNTAKTFLHEFNEN